MTTTNDTYELIGNLAIAVYSKGIKISLSSLNSILKDKNPDLEYGNNRALGQGVSAAWRYWEKLDPVIHHAIAHTYVDKEGNPPWA